MPLDFANETWIRIYKRDTVTLKILTWQSRALLWELLRKADRAGVIDVSFHGERGLAVMVGMPMEIVSVSLAELVETGTIIKCEGCFVFPRFIEAQETPASDKRRQADLRERRRDLALYGSAVDEETVTKRDERITKREQTVTKRIQNVTRGHAASRRVTKRKEKKLKERERVRAEALTSPSFKIWEHQENLRQGLGLIGLDPTPDRLARVENLLSLGITEEQCQLVLNQLADECRRDRKKLQWFNGDTHWNKKNFDRTLGAVKVKNLKKNENSQDPSKTESAADNAFC